MKLNAHHVPQAACLLFASYFILAFLYVALGSMSYPFHIEWMEGQSIDIIQRVRDGLPLYVEPSIDYVPFLYTPYYYYVAAFVSLFTGVDFFAGRLVSTLAALGVGGILYCWVKREGGSWQHGLIAAGLFFATYPLSARWMDVARIDSLFLFLTLAGLYVFYFYRHPVLAAALLAIAFFTKQSALMIAAPALAAMLLIDWKHALKTGLLLAAMVAAGIALAQWVSNGWFWFYVFDVPAGHGMDRRMIWGFWRGDLLRPLGMAAAVGLAGFALALRGKKALWYAALAAGLLGAAYASRLHSYGWANVLMPAHAALALFAGLALAALEKKDMRLGMAAALVLAVQFYGLIYTPARFIPGEAARARGEKFLADFAAVPGDVFAPELQWVQTRVGKKSYTLGMAAFDLMRADLKEKNGIKRGFAREMAEALRQGKFDAVMPGRLLKLPEREGKYRFDRRLAYPKEYVTGAINFLRTDVFVRIQEDSEDAQ